MRFKVVYSVMSLAVVGTAAALVTAAAQPASAATVTTTGAVAPTISVVGAADEKIVPDMAQISAGVTSNGATAAKAQQANNTAMQKVMSALKADGIASADVQTQWYNISPSYGQPGKSGQQSIVGFQATDNITVTISKLSRVGAIVDDLVKAGANEINNVNYMVSNPSAIQQKLYTAALDNARTQAQVIAQKLGLTITGVASVDASGGTSTPIVPLRMEAATASSAVLSPGTQDISTSIKVVYTAQ